MPSPFTPFCSVSGIQHTNLKGQRFCSQCGCMTSAQVVQYTPEHLPLAKSTKEDVVEVVDLSQSTEEPLPTIERFKHHSHRTAEAARQTAINHTKDSTKTKMASGLNPFTSRSNTGAATSIPLKPIRTTVVPIQRLYYLQNNLDVESGMERIYIKASRQRKSFPTS